jgi:hypothetical protein
VAHARKKAAENSLTAGMAITRGAEGAKAHPAYAPLHAAWALANLAAASPAVTAALLAAAGGPEAVAPRLLALLEPTLEPEVREMAGWAAGNLAMGSAAARDALLAAGGGAGGGGGVIVAVLQHVVALDPANPPLMDAVVEADGGWRPHWGRRMAGVLANICGGAEPRPGFTAIDAALPIFQRLLEEEDSRLVVPVLRGIANFATPPNHAGARTPVERAADRTDAVQRIYAIAGSEGLIRRVVELMRRCVDGAKADGLAASVLEHGLTVLQVNRFS